MIHMVSAAVWEWASCSSVLPACGARAAIRGSASVPWAFWCLIIVVSSFANGVERLCDNWTVFCSDDPLPEAGASAVRGSARGLHLSRIVRSKLLVDIMCNFLFKWETNASRSWSEVQKINPERHGIAHHLSVPGGDFLVIRTGNADSVLKCLRLSSSDSMPLADRMSHLDRSDDNRGDLVIVSDIDTGHLSILILLPDDCLNISDLTIVFVKLDNVAGGHPHWRHFIIANSLSVQICSIVKSLALTAQVREGWSITCAIAKRKEVGSSVVSRVIGLHTYTGELVLESPADVRVVNPTGTATVVTAFVPLVVAHCQCYVLSAYVRLSTIIVPV